MKVKNKELQHASEYAFISVMVLSFMYDLLEAIPRRNTLLPIVSVLLITQV